MSKIVAIGFFNPEYICSERELVSRLMIGWKNAATIFPILAVMQFHRQLAQTNGRRSLKYGPPTLTKALEALDKVAEVLKSKQSTDPESEPFKKTLQNEIPDTLAPKSRKLLKEAWKTNRRAASFIAACYCLNIGKVDSGSGWIKAWAKSVIQDSWRSRDFMKFFQIAKYFEDEILSNVRRFHDSETNKSRPYVIKLPPSIKAFEQSMFPLSGPLLKDLEALLSEILQDKRLVG